jgi:DNA-binding Lrp family transcriptional regulator
VKESRKVLKQAAEELEVSPEEVPRTVKKLLEDTRDLEAKIKALKTR